MAKELARSEAPGAADAGRRLYRLDAHPGPQAGPEHHGRGVQRRPGPLGRPGGARDHRRTPTWTWPPSWPALPTVLILRCARRHSEAYGPYLGTILRVLTTRLDDLGERQPNGAAAHPGRAHPGRVPGAGQAGLAGAGHQPGAQAAHLGADRGPVAGPVRPRLPRQGGGRPAAGGPGDQDRAWRLRPADGRVLQPAERAADAGRDLAVRVAPPAGRHDQDGATASLRGRPLLLPDDLIQPAKGHATVFAAYSQGGHAEQAIFHAELTPFFRRKDWRLERVQPSAPLTVPKETRSPTAPKPAGRSAPEPERRSGRRLRLAPVRRRTGNDEQATTRRRRRPADVADPGAGAPGAGCHPGDHRRGPGRRRPCGPVRLWPLRGPALPRPEAAALRRQRPLHRGRPAPSRSSSRRRPCAAE